LKLLICIIKQVKTGTVGPLASQAEIGVWIQASGAPSHGSHPLPQQGFRKNFEIVYAIPAI